MNPIKLSQPALDPRVRRALMPTRIVWQSQGEAAPQDADLLLQNNWGQALTQGVPCCVLKNSGEAPGILLDFGREIHGSVQLVVGSLAGNRPVRARLRLGESVSEAMFEPNNDHAMHDMIIHLPPMASQEYGLSGFRFARLDLIDEGDELRLVAFRAMTLMRPDAPVGSFACSDERLNRIWQVGADTVHLCMQDFLWDGPKRDRCVWIGDMHPETSVISAVWGAHEIVPQSLDWVRDSTPLPRWMNGISSYSMWWVLIHRDWFVHHGDAASLAAQRDYLTQLLALLAARVDDRGGLLLDDRLFLDWPSSENPQAISTGLHALLAMSLRAGAHLCEVLGESETKVLCEAAALRLESNAPPLIVSSKQASSLLALAGMHSAQSANEEVLAVEPLRGVSTFYGYYVLQARAMAGDYASCLEVIRRYWGAMLDLGATSFWEDFDLEWIENAGRIDEIVPPEKSDLHRERGNYCYKGLRHSFCHGWAAGPTAWLSEHVLGLRPLEARCTKVLCAPHLEDLSWAEGTFPTPHGPIRVRHQRQSDGSIKSSIEAPDEVAIVRASA